MTQTIYLVSCVGQKQEAPAAARDLYVSPWFLKARRYVEKRRQPWFILSAQYGVVAPDEVVGPYERTLNALGVRARRDWATLVQEQLNEKVPSDSNVVMLAGRHYREHLIDYFASRNIQVEIPLEGMRIGEQLGWFDRQCLTDERT